jgi:cell wall-associated NlpC family hydrolase
MRDLVRGSSAALGAAIVAFVAVVAPRPAGASPAGPDPIVTATAAWQDTRTAAALITVAASAATARADHEAAGVLAARAAGVATSASPWAARWARATADADGLQAAAAGRAEAAARTALLAAISDRTGAPLDALAQDWATAPPAALDVLVAGLLALGTPYRYGGAGPDSFDCSGFVAMTYAAVGIELPHQSGSQWALAQPVLVARPGDVLISNRLGHIGLAVGAGVQLHAPQTGDVVRLSPVPPDARPGRLLPQ